MMMIDGDDDDDDGDDSDDDGDDGHPGPLEDARSSVTYKFYDRCYHLIARVDVAIS